MSKGRGHQVSIVMERIKSREQGSLQSGAYTIHEVVAGDQTRREGFHRCKGGVAELILPGGEIGQMDLIDPWKS